MKTNNSQDFKGTGKVYLELRRENTAWEEKECDACGKPKLENYWKMGMANCDKLPYKAVYIICDSCHDVLTK